MVLMEGPIRLLAFAIAIPSNAQVTFRQTTALPGGRGSTTPGAADRSARRTFTVVSPEVGAERPHACPYYWAGNTDEPADVYFRQVEGAFLRNHKGGQYVLPRNYFIIELLGVVVFLLLFTNCTSQFA